MPGHVAQQSAALAAFSEDVQPQIMPGLVACQATAASSDSVDPKHMSGLLAFQSAATAASSDGVLHPKLMSGLWHASLK